LSYVSYQQNRISKKRVSRVALTSYNGTILRVCVTLNGTNWPSVSVGGALSNEIIALQRGEELEFVRSAEQPSMDFNICTAVTYISYTRLRRV